MIRTQKQVKKDIQTFDDIIVSLKKQLKYVELSRQEMTKQLTIPVIVQQSEQFKCRNVACNKMTDRSNGTVFCDKHKPYLGI